MRLPHFVHAAIWFLIPVLSVLPLVWTKPPSPEVDLGGNVTIEGSEVIHSRNAREPLRFIKMKENMSN